MLTPKNETEDLLLSITKHCQTLIKKLIENQKTYQNLKCLHREKRFNSIHFSRLKDIG